MAWVKRSSVVPAPLTSKVSAVGRASPPNCDHGGDKHDQVQPAGLAIPSGGAVVVQSVNSGGKSAKGKSKGKSKPPNVKAMQVSAQRWAPCPLPPAPCPLSASALWLACAVHEHSLCDCKRLITLGAPLRANANHTLAMRAMFFHWRNCRPRGVAE